MPVLPTRPNIARVFVDAVDAEAIADVVEVDVARLLDGVPQVERAVPGLAIAPERVAVERRVTGTVELRVGSDHAFLEAGDRHHDLERRPRRVRALNQPVGHRLLRIGHEAATIRPDRCRPRRRSGRTPGGWSCARISPVRGSRHDAGAGEVPAPKAVLERLLQVVTRPPVSLAEVDATRDPALRGRGVRGPRGGA